MSDREDNEFPTSELGCQRAEKSSNNEELWRQLIEKQNQNMMALISTLQPQESSRRFALPEFNPDKEESDARSWCATADICFEDNAPRGGQLVVLISKALKGTASAWLSQVSYPGISWPEFKDLFTARFISTDTCAGTLINLNNDKLKDTESLAACASRIITSLMTRWKDCTKEQIAVATALAHISQHDSRLQRLAFTTEITSRQQLQKELQAFSYLKRKAPAAEALSTSDSKRAKFYKPSSSKCFGCGKLGHRQAECRSKPKNYKPSSPVKSDVASTSHRADKASSIRCFKCGALGHVASRCTSGAGTSASTQAERRVDLCVVQPPTGYLQHRGQSYVFHYDSGAECSLIKETLATRFSGKRSFNIISLTGIGQSSVKSIEQILAKVIINEHSLELLLHVLPDIYLRSDLMIGREILCLGFSLNSKKCSFLKSKIEFLGYEIENGNVRPNRRKIESLTALPPPESVTQLRQFIGLASYFRQFVAQFACIMVPLYRLTSLKGNFIWKPEHEVIRQKKYFNIDTKSSIQAAKGFKFKTNL